MLILLRLDPADGRAMRAYRLQVKERLYRFNFVSLCVYFILARSLLHFPYSVLTGEL
jgi:hypothetical protein